MNELLPCPFCGSHNLVEGYHSPFVICDDCGAFGPGHADMTHDEAIAAWNSRAERTCRQEERGWGTEGDHARVWLTCGHDCMVPTVQDLPNYCPNCGAKVVDE